MPNQCQCYLCGKAFVFGPDTYDGRKVRTWGQMICNNCDRSSHDGLVATEELLARLASDGIVPQFNDKDHIVVPHRGS